MVHRLASCSVPYASLCWFPFTVAYISISYYISFNLSFAHLSHDPASRHLLVDFSLLTYFVYSSIYLFLKFCYLSCLSNCCCYRLYTFPFLPCFHFSSIHVLIIRKNKGPAKLHVNLNSLLAKMKTFLHVYFYVNLLQNDWYCQRSLRLSIAHPRFSW